MLQVIGASSIDELIQQTIPSDIFSVVVQPRPAQSEVEFLTKLGRSAHKNTLNKSYIGMGYYGWILQRHITYDWNQP